MFRGDGEGLGEGDLEGDGDGDGDLEGLDEGDGDGDFLGGTDGGILGDVDGEGEGEGLDEGVVEGVAVGVSLGLGDGELTSLQSAEHVAVFGGKHCGLLGELGSSTTLAFETTVASEPTELSLRFKETVTVVTACGTCTTLHLMICAPFIPQESHPRGSISTTSLYSPTLVLPSVNIPREFGFTPRSGLYIVMPGSTLIEP